MLMLEPKLVCDRPCSLRQTEACLRCAFPLSIAMWKELGMSLVILPADLMLALATFAVR